ncbi:hypothetical protein IU479_32485 [Nocardia abscessus]|uniref:hypothetical protein n=1 Tax=Nocardia abscessus TaxID=120957 RepID=UPI00189478DF|nr:hypothetical protein [Nocardia abscessus]MBF6222805.1 hypothetical protein [Nocardia abscessus]
MHSSQQTSTGATSSHIRSTHCANSFGPYQLREKLISLAVTNVLRGRKIPVTELGLDPAEWIEHIEDRPNHAAAT